MWGLDIITVVAAGSVFQTACIAKRVPKNPVGIRFFLMHELLATDWYRKFWSWFQMPLLKIEELTDIFISRGNLKHARSLMRQSDFFEWLELLIMAVLYRLGTGALFFTCQALCNICLAKICKIFPSFLHAMHEMRDEYILLLTNITQLRWITEFFKEASLPGCCRSMDVVHVKWSACPTGNHNCAKGKCGYPCLGFQCITNFNHRISAVY
jgi:hypothetical protein